MASNAAHATDAGCNKCKKCEKSEKYEKCDNFVTSVKSVKIMKSMKSVTIWKFAVSAGSAIRTSYFVFPKMLVLGKQINVCVSHMSTVLKDKLGVGPLRTYTVPCKFFFIEFLKQNQGLKI
jgi:hypothetical protein